LLKRYRIALALVGLCLAAGSATALYQLPGKVEEKVPVLTMVQDIEPFDQFHPEWVLVKWVPPDCRLPGAFTSYEAVAEKRAAVKMYAGEQVISKKVLTGDMTPLVEERYLHVPLKGVRLKPGEKIDIYLVYQPGQPFYSGVERVLAGKRVARVLDEAGNSLHNGNGRTTQSFPVQAGIEIIVSGQEIEEYLEKEQYAKRIIVRYGEGAYQGEDYLSDR
jgi:hypothetical protein